MEELLDDHVENPQLTDKEVFTKIWFSPRTVFRFINDNNYDKHTLLMMFFVGVSTALNNAMENHLGDRFSLFPILMIACIVGPSASWLAYYFFAWVISLTARLLGDKGNVQSLYKVMAYASVPYAFITLCFVLVLLFNGQFLFTSDAVAAKVINGTEVQYNWSMIILALAELILGCWALVFMTVGISEVLKLSIGKTILILFLTILIIFVPLIAIVVFWGAGL